MLTISYERFSFFVPVVPTNLSESPEPGAGHEKSQQNPRQLDRLGGMLPDCYGPGLAMVAPYRPGRDQDGMDGKTGEQTGEQNWK